jgi:L-threonylcarbamoyladenylate synthase
MTMTSSIDAAEAQRLRECVAHGGVAVFPTDTVYGVCCDPSDESAARRLYQLKGRPSKRPAAVMFFSLQAALAAVGELRDCERAALEALLPGPVTVLLENRGGAFGAACRSDPATLGLRVPELPDELRALGTIDTPVMQTSANLSGEPDARTLADVPSSLREGADLVLDGGELPGTPSTVVDLRDYEQSGSWYVLREGALPGGVVRELLQAAH